jgi:hypothetical protein
MERNSIATANFWVFDVENISQKLVDAMNIIEEVKKELRWKNYLPNEQKKLEEALVLLNEIAAFYKI